MNKAKLIATSGICAAIAVVCLILAGIPVLKWIMLILAVFASIAVSIPIILDPKRGIVYSLLTYVVASAIGVFMGMANIIYVAPVIVFCMPSAIVKVYGETFKISTEFNEGEQLEDPFGGESKTFVQVKVNGKTRLPTVVRWVIYYALLEAALALSGLATWLWMPDMFSTLVNNNAYIWLLIAAQFVVPPFNLLMRGCLIAVTKILRKVVKPQ